MSEFLSISRRIFQLKKKYWTDWARELPWRIVWAVSYWWIWVYLSLSELRQRTTQMRQQLRDTLRSTWCCSYSGNSMRDPSILVFQWFSQTSLLSVCWNHWRIWNPQVVTSINEVDCGSKEWNKIIVLPQIIKALLSLSLPMTQKVTHS